MLLEWIFIVQASLIILLLGIVIVSLVRMGRRAVIKENSVIDVYQHARKIIEKGGNVSQVSRYCNISHSEAVLLEAIHRKSSSTSEI